jgi:integrase
MGKLTALKIATLGPGFHSDGDGLFLQVTSPTARSWVYRFQLNGKTRDLGLGSARDISLKRARELLAEKRALRAQGVDPVEHRREQRAQKKIESTRAVTFKECAERYTLMHEPIWRNTKHRQQWASTLRDYAYPAIGDLAVQEITTADVLRALQPIWMRIPETASRLRGRIEQVLDWATVDGLRLGENPARWRGHLAHKLPTPGKVRKVEHHPALPYPELPALMADLRRRESISARALEVTILTSCRTTEVTSAEWAEVDLGGHSPTWTIPARRMKAARDHRIPLSKRAVEILRDLYSQRQNEFVFSNPIRGNPLSNMAMLKLLSVMGRRDLTVHGFRSTFRDWAAERTGFPNHVIEQALAHAISSKVEAAYRRTDLLDQRRKLMEAWAAFCAKPASDDANVVPLKVGVDA